MAIESDGVSTDQSKIGVGIGETDQEIAKVVS